MGYLLSLTQDRTQNTKELLIRVLLEKPLSIAEAQANIRSTYKLALTYQAVRKAVFALRAERIVQGKGRYRVSKDWLLSSRSIIDRLLVTYEQGARFEKIQTEVLSKDYSLYTMKSLYELDEFWGDVLLAALERERDASERSLYSCGHYAWWMLLNLGRETDIFTRIIQAGFSIHIRLLAQNPLNRWATRVYRGIQVDARVRTVNGLPEDILFTVIGETLIQAKFQPEQVQSMRRFFARYKEMASIPQGKLSELAHSTRFPIELTVIRNRAVADTTRSFYATRLREGERAA